MAGPGKSPEGASPRLSQVLARRTVVAVAAIVILSVPFAVFAAISGQVTASSFAALGGATALMNLMIGGRAIAYLSVGLLTALTPVAIVSGAVPVAGAGLMAIMCFGVGLSAAQGLHRGLLLIPMYLAFMIIAPPPWSGHTAVDRTSTSYLLWNMLFLGGGALWVVIYYLLPLDRTSGGVAVTMLVIGLVALIGLITFQVRSILVSRFPGLRAVEALATSLSLFLVLFASTYLVIATESAGSFSQQLTHTDALYFTVTVFATVGFGDITAKTEAARLVVIGQMIIDLIIIGIGAKIILGAVQQSRQRRPERANTPRPSE